MRSMSDRAHHCYEFGPFRFDAAEGQLLRAGRLLKMID
jgi:hypothetical protein